MKRTLLTVLAGIAIVGAAFSPPAAAGPNATAAATPRAATGAAKSPSPKPKDPCAKSKSKWAHMQCEEFDHSAPGDEYFGRMKISYLGINNTYKDGAISAGAYTTDPRLISKLDFASEALERWAAKYPGDPQLARSYFLGIQVLRKVYTQPEQERTWQYIHLLVTKYGNTYFGKVMKASLAHGFTEHWIGMAQVCPTALPSGVTSEVTPSATETPTTPPGQPSVDIITPPCIAQSTPEPQESPASTAPSGAPSPSPTSSQQP